MTLQIDIFLYIAGGSGQIKRIFLQNYLSVTLCVEVRELLTKEDMALHEEGEEEAASTMVILDDAWKETNELNQSGREG